MSFVISKLTSLVIFAAWFVVGTYVLKGIDRVVQASYDAISSHSWTKQS